MGRIEYKVGDIVVIKKNPCGFKKYSITEIMGKMPFYRHGVGEPEDFFPTVRYPESCVTARSSWSLFNVRYERDENIINPKYILCKANEREQFLYHILGIYQSTDRIRSKQLAYKWRSVRGRMLDEA